MKRFEGTPAHFAAASVTKKKIFKHLSPCHLMDWSEEVQAEKFRRFGKWACTLEKSGSSSKHKFCHCY